MTYSSGSTIAAADINSFLTTVNAIYGTGTSTRGYGQSAASQAAVVAGNTITAAQWVNLRTMLVTCMNHQGSSTSTLLAAPTTSSVITQSSTLATLVSAADTNRLTPTAASMTLTTGTASSTRASTWSSSITATIDAIWASEDAARFFFNTGGNVRFHFAHSPTTATQDTDWGTLLTGLGTLSISANALTTTGSGTITSTGYYQMPTTATQAFIKYSTGSAYTSNSVSGTFQRLNYTGTNGGNGTGFRMVFTLLDQHTGTYDTVQAGTLVSFDTYKANTTYLTTAIGSPTFTTQVAF